MDIVELGMKVDSRPVKKAGADMDRFAASGGKASDSATALSQTTGKLSAKMKALGVVAAATAVALAGKAMFSGAVREAEKFQTTTLRMNAIIEATGGAAQRSAKQLREQARALALITLESTDGILRAQQTLLTFRRVQGDVFDRTIRNAADLAAAMGTDLNSAVLQLAKAMENPLEGMSALSRSGTVFTKTQKAMVKSMVESGNLMGAQRFILSELEAQYRGTAEAAASGLAGAVDTMGQRFQETQLAMAESFNLLSAKTSVVRAVSAALLAMTKNMDDIAETIKRMAHWVGVAAIGLAVSFTPAIIAATIAVGRFVAGLLLTRAALIRTGIGAVAVGLGELAYRMNIFGGAADESSEAQGRLNEALGIYAETAGPAARAAVIDSTKMLIEETVAKLASAQATLTIARAKQIQVQMAMATNRLTEGGSGYATAAQQNVDKAQLVLTSLNWLITDLLRQLGSLEAVVTLDEKLTDAADSANKLARQLSGAKKEASALALFLASIPRSLKTASATIAGLEASIANLKSGGDAATASMAKYAAILRDELSAKTLKGIDIGFQEHVRKEINQVIRLEKTVRSLAAEEQKLLDVLVKIVETGPSGMPEMEDALEAATLSAKELAYALQGRVVSAIVEMADAFGDFVVSGFRDFKGFVASVLNSFKSMLSQMIALAVRNRILISMGVSVPGSAASAATGGLLSGGGGSLLGELLGSGLVGGIATGIASIGTSFATLGGLLSGTIPAAIAAIGIAIPAIGLVIFALMALVGKTKQLGAGLEISVAGAEASITAFSTIQKTWLFGLIKRTKTHFSSVDASVAGPISDALRSIRISVVDLASAINVGASAFDDFAYNVTISLAGLTEEQKQKEIQDAIAGYGQALAGLVPGLDAFTGTGESAIGALERLGWSLVAVNEAMSLLDKNMLSVSLAGADVASQLIEMFGSLSAFTAATSSYWLLFYSEQERVDRTTQALVDTFDKLNLVMPRSREQYRSLIDGLDITTEAGRKLFTALVGLATGFDFILPKISNFTSAIEDLAGAVVNDLESRISGASDLARSSSQAARVWDQTAHTLRDVVRQMLGSDAGGTLGAQQLMATRSAYTRALGAARGGDVEAAQSIPDLSRVFLSSALLRARTSEEYARIAGSVRGDIQLLAGVAGIEGANQGALQALYEEQVEIMSDLRDNLLSGDPLTNDTLNRFMFSLVALESTIELMSDALSTPLGTLKDAIHQLTKALFGNQTAIPFFAAGGRPLGGLRIVGEPRTFGEDYPGGPVRQTPPTRGPIIRVSNDEVVQELRMLRDETRQLQLHIVRNTKKTSDIYRKWDVDGLPSERSA